MAGKVGSYPQILNIQELLCFIIALIHYGLRGKVVYFCSIVGSCPVHINH